MNSVRRLLSGRLRRNPNSLVWSRLASTDSKTEPDETKNHQKYIDSRVNNLFNIILADIISSQQFNQSPNKPNAMVYQNPYDSKDQILRDLVTNPENVNHQYSIQELIEEEFQMEISDKEFEQFKTLKDIVTYISQRLEIRNQLMSTHSPDYAYNSYWY